VELPGGQLRGLVSVTVVTIISRTADREALNLCQERRKLSTGNDHLILMAIDEHGMEKSLGFARQDVSSRAASRVEQGGSVQLECIFRITVQGRNGQGCKSEYIWFHVVVVELFEVRRR
jgi:hypothetical protein